MNSTKLRRFHSLTRVGVALAVVLCVLTSVATSFKANAAVGINRQINFQGKLVNPNGTNVTDGSYSIVFSIYSVATAGTAIWSETQTPTVTNGIFQVNLGSVVALPGSVDFNTDNIFLGIKVGADAEMTPRIQFTAVPQAFNSEKLGGLDKTGFIQNTTTQQTSSNFNISGTGVVGTSLTTPLLQSSAATALTITGNAASTWGTTAGDLTIQAGSGTVSLGTSTVLGSNGNLSIQATGYVRIGDSGTPTVATADDELYVLGDLEIDGNADFAGTLAVNGDIISSDSNLSIQATGYVRIGDSGTPTVATADDELYVLGDLEVDANADVGGTLTVTGAGTFSSTLNVAATGGYYYGGTSSPLSLELTRTVPTTVNNYVEIGNFNLGSGGHNFRVSISVSDANFSVTKSYTIPVFFNGTSGTWKTVLPTEDSGAWTGTQDFALDINSTNDIASLRLRRSAGVIAGTAKVRIESVGSTSDVFTATALTGTVAAPTAFYGGVTSNVTTGNVGIGTTAATSQLEVKTSAGAADGQGLRLTNGVANRSWELKSGSPSVNNDYFTIKDITANAVRFTITQTGEVGIGNTSPTYMLDVGGTFRASSTSNAVLGNGTTGGVTIGDGTLTKTSGSGFLFNSTVNGQTGINTGAGAGTARIDASGNLVNIGTVNTSGIITLGALGATNNANYLCRNSSNQLAGCNTTGTGAAFVQDGNSFGATAVLGTNDSQSLAFETGGTTRLTIDTGGNAALTGNLTVGGTYGYNRTQWSHSSGTAAHTDLFSQAAGMVAYDVFAYAPVTNVEYDNAGVWTTWAGAAIDRALDDNVSTSVSIDATHKKFRFGLDVGAWSIPGLFSIERTYASPVPSYTITIETDDNTAFTSPTVEYAGTSFASGEVSYISDMISNADRYYRFTIDSTEAFGLAEISAMSTRTNSAVSVISPYQKDYTSAYVTQGLAVGYSAGQAGTPSNGLLVAGDFATNGTTRLTSAGILQNVAYNGSSIADAYLDNNITVDWTGLQNYPAACAAGQAITQLGDTVTCSPFATSDTTYTAGNDLDLSGTTFNIEPQLDFVSTINQTSANLTLQTTTSGNIILNSAGTIELQDNTNITGNLDVSGTITGGSTNQFTVSAAGGVTAVGVNSGTGAFTGTGGATISGAAVNLNNTGTAATTIGNTTGALTLTGSSILLNSGNLSRTAAGTTTFNLVDAANTTFALTNSGTGVANLTVDGTIAVATLGATNNANYLCRNSSNQLAGCTTTGTGAMFVQGGNSFGATAVLGTNDAQSLAFETGGTTRLTIDTSGNAALTGNLTTSNGSLLGTFIDTQTTNLVANGNFETNATGWTGNALSTLATSSAERYFGGASLNLKYSGSGDGYATYTLPMPATGLAGRPYSFSFWAKASVAGPASNSLFVQGLGGTIGTTTNCSLGTINFTTTWQKFKASCTMASNNDNTSWRVVLRPSASSTTETYFDGINVQYGTSGTEFSSIVADDSGNVNIYDGGLAIGTNTLSGNKLNVQGGNVNFSGNLDIGGNLVITGTTTMNGDLLMGAGDQIDFTDEAGDKAYWYGVDYGTGIEANTLTDWTASRYRIRTGGTSVSSGTEKFTVTSTGVKIGGGDATYALDVAGVIWANTAGSGDAIRIGNDSKLVDIDVANTLGVYGLQDTTVGSIKLGSGGGTISGASGGLTLTGATSTSSTLAVGALGATNNANYLCRNSSNQLAGCNTTGTGAAFVQDGNSFGAQAVLGTNDAQSLAFETGGTTRLTIDTSGNAALTGNLSVGGRTLTLSNFKSEYRWKWGGGTDLNWKKIADITISGSNIYAGASFEVDVLDTNTNLGGTANASPMRFYVSALRSSGTQDVPDSGTVAGPVADYVRLVRTALGVYELQVRQTGNYKHLEVTARQTSDNGSLTVAYVDSPVDGSIVGTNYMPSVTGYTQQFPNVGVSGTFTGANGATVSGAAINLNNNSNFAVNLATGTSTGTVSIGGTAAQTIGIGNGATGIKAVTVGSTVATSSLTLQSGAGMSLNAVGAANTTVAISNSGAGVANLTVDGSITGSSTIQGAQLIATIATGTAPLAVTSTTLVANLNVDLLDGIDSSQLAQSKVFASTDFNSETGYSGLSSINGATNTPFGAAWYTLENNRHRGGISDGNVWGSQIATGMTAYTNRMAMRVNTGTAGVWTAWNEIWTAGSDGSGSGMDADLLDGQSSAAFAPTSGSASYIQNTSVSQAGANFNIGANGVIGGTLNVASSFTGTGGATISGAAVNLNNNSNFAVNINTGSSTGTVSIGGTAAQTINIGNGASGVKAVTVGSTVATSSLTLQSGAGISINASGAANTTVAISNSGAGVANLTVDGSITAATGLIVSAGGASITGNSTIAGTLGSLTGLTSSGTITFSGLATAGIVTNTAGGVLGTTNAIAANLGGTGFNSYTVGDLLFANSASTLAKLADVALGSCLISGGVGAAPSWGSCGTGSITGLTLAGTSGTSQAISNSDTITIAAGTNITTTAGATDTVTVATVNNPTFSTSVTTPSLTSSGALTVNATGAALTLQTTTSGNIVINGAGSLDIQDAATFASTATFNGVSTFNTDVNMVFAGTENLAITANGAPTADMVAITNSGQAVTTAGVNAFSVNYVGGAAAIEAAAGRIDLQPGGTTGGIWSAWRVVHNATGPATGVTSNGVKIEGPTTGGAGIFNGINIANVGATTTGGVVRGINITATNSQAAGTIRGIQLNNLTAGAASEIGIDLGTGWDNLMTYNNGATVLINGSGQWNLAQVTGSLADGNVSDTLTSSLFVGSGSTTTAIDLATAEVGGILGAANGGTGQNSYTIGDMLYASGATTLSKLAAVAAGSCLISNGVGAAPLWGSCSTGATLQTAYTADPDGSNAVIALTSADGAVIIRDNATPIGGSLFAVQNSAATVSYLNVTTTGISSSGSVTAVGVNSGTGAFTGTGGATISGAAVNLNNNSNFAVNIKTGTSTGTTTIGNNSNAANAIIIDGGTAANSIQIGNTTTAHGIQIGTSASAAQTIVIGSTNAGSALTLQGGTAGIIANSDIVASGAATGTTGTTEATARTNVTTVTLTAAGAFANNDIIYINNAGQDYYTRIVSGGGTTSLVVSPAVSYDVSAPVTKYNVENIGAKAGDYTTLSNRFFQGYFLGGVVTGAGSTTLSDGSLASTGELIVRVGATQRKSATFSTAGELTVHQQDDTNEGGQISLVGAAAYSSSILDNFQGAFRIVQNSTSQFVVQSNALSDSLHINATGVGIGTVASAKLHVLGPVNTSTTTPLFVLDNAATSTQTVMELRVAGTARARLRADNGGNVVLNGTGTGLVYLNYESGTGGVVFGNGAGGTAAFMSSAALLDMSGTGRIDFGSAVGDKIHLYSNTYGIGIESGTHTSWTNSGFRWREGGTSVSSGTDVASIGTGGAFTAVNVGTRYLSGASSDLCYFNILSLHDFMSRCTSLASLKHNVEDLGLGLDTIRQLTPRKYNWNNDGRADLGFIAEEVQSVNPLLSEYDENGNLTSVKYRHMVALAIEGIQELDSMTQNNTTAINSIQSQLNSGMFGNISVSGVATVGALKVTGNATVAGELTVTGDTTVANLYVGGKLISRGNVPGVALGSALTGVLGASVTNSGTDTAGSVSIVSGTETAQTGVLAEVTFTSAYATAPKIVISGNNAKSAKLGAYVVRTATGFQIVTDDVVEQGVTYNFDYIIIEAVGVAP